VDIQHSLIVAEQGSSTLDVIDIRTDKIVQTVEFGRAPSRLLLSTTADRLVGLHAGYAGATILDLASFATWHVALSFIPTLVALSDDGLTVALADPASGTIAFVDVLKGRVSGPIVTPAPLRDMLFSTKGDALYVSGDKLDGIAVIDPDHTSPLVTLASASVADGAVRPEATLRRSATGRRLYATPLSGSGIDVFDLDARRSLPPISATSGPLVAFPSVLGGYLLLSDNEHALLTIISTGPEARAPVRLKGGSDVTNLYTAWLDTVAFVPSARTNSLWVYDLDALKLESEIALPGTPIGGAVTEDGRKFYLPLRDKSQILVIDAATHHQLATIPLEANPISVVAAGSYGVCH